MRRAIGERRALKPLKDAGEAVGALVSASGVNIHPDRLVLTDNSWDSNNVWRHGLRLKTVRAFLKSALPETL